jgi:hypothetical protein
MLLTYFLISLCARLLKRHLIYAIIKLRRKEKNYASIIRFIKASLTIRYLLLSKFYIYFTGFAINKTLILLQFSVLYVSILLKHGCKIYSVVAIVWFSNVAGSNVTTFGTCACIYFKFYMSLFISYLLRYVIILFNNLLLLMMNSSFVSSLFLCI